MRRKKECNGVNGHHRFPEGQRVRAVIDAWRNRGPYPRIFVLSQLMLMGCCGHGWAFRPGGPGAGNPSLDAAIGLLASLSGAISDVARPFSSLTAALASPSSFTGHLQSLVLLELLRGWLSV